MPVPATFNGVVYQIPTQGDLNWAPPLTRYLVALAAGAISPSGGSYPLTSDLNFGSSFGLVAPYYKSSSANISTAGVLRLSNTDSIGWRNFANNGNLLLGVNTSDQLTFNGTAIQPAITLLDGEIWIGNSSNLPIGRILSGGITVTDTGVTSISSNYITNAMVNSAAAIAYSKLNLSGSIVNADIFSGAAIAYSKLNLSNSLVNADINTSAAIAFSKLATLTNTHILVGSAGGVATDVAVSGDATLANTGALTLATVNGNVGSFTLASITVDAKGRITAASSGSAGSGTVTSVAMTVPTFLSVAGSPITTSGTLAVTLSGTALPVVNGGTGVTTSTGSGNTVLSTSPTLVTPVLGAASATSLSFSSTSGIIGTTTNNNAAAGSVGEYVESVVSAVNFPTSTQYGDATSISLTAGDWDVTLNYEAGFVSGVISGMNLGISTTTGNSTTGLVAGSNYQRSVFIPTAVSNQDSCIANWRLSLSATTTVYAKFQATYTVGAPQFTGRLSARRLR